MAIESMMDGRYSHLCNTVLGYKVTSIPFLEYHQGHYFACNAVDDMGIYLYIPYLASFFNLDTDTAISLFFTTITGLSCFIGLMGIFFLVRSWWLRLFALAELAVLTALSMEVIDVYRAYYVVTVALLPWALIIIKQHRLLTLLPFYAMSGLLLGFAHTIRAHAGTGVLLFMLGITLSTPWPWLRKMFLLTLLALGFYLPVWSLNNALATCQHYLARHLPHQQLAQTFHPFWHPIYVSFGFLANNYDLRWDDGWGEKKAKSMDPTITTYPNAVSEKILRHEVIKLFKEHPLFVLHTLWAKIGILLMYFLLWANIGLLAIWYYPLPRYLQGSFIAMACFYSLFCFFATPYRHYLLGFFASALFYGIVNINHFLEQNNIKHKV
jgi:hypothetical protein